MKDLNNNLNKRKYIDQEAYEWTKEQSARNTKETFVYITIAITALAVYGSYAYMLIQKLRA